MLRHCVTAFVYVAKAAASMSVAVFKMSRIGSVLAWSVCAYGSMAFDTAQFALRPFFKDIHNGYSLPSAIRQELTFICGGRHILHFLCQADWN
jgi:hypothetical protein